MALKKQYILLISGIALIALAWNARFSIFAEPNVHEAAEILYDGIVDKRGEARAEINKAQSRFNARGIISTMVEFSDEYAALYDERGLFLAAYEDNELVFYSDNRVVFEHLFGPGIPDEQYLRLDNGWYGLIKHIEDGREFYALFLLRTAYPHENTHLQNRFPPDIPLGPHFDLSVQQHPEAAPVAINNDNVLYIHKTNSPVQHEMWFNLVLLAAGVIFLLVALFQLASKLLPLWLAISCIPLLVIGVRLLWLSASNPLQTLKLFDPALYASSFLFPSLGDFLINSLLLVLVCHYVFSQLKRYSPQQVHPIWQTVLLLGILLFGLAITPLITGLIENSRINFNLNDVFNLNIFTLLGLIAIGCLFYAWFTLTSSVLAVVNRSANSTGLTTLIVAGALLVHTIVAHMVGVVDFKVILWPIVGVFLVAQHLSFDKTEMRFRHGILLLFYFSLIVSLALLKYNSIKEHNERLVYAEKLASDEDPVTELLFNSWVTSLNENNEIQTLLEQPNRYTNAYLAERITALFIDRYWNKYNIDVHIYHPNGNYWGILPESRPPALEDFDALIANEGFATSTSPYLYHLYNYPENLSYLAKVPVYKNDTTLQAWVVVGLESTLFPDEIGFPGLLIDDSADNLRNLENYSFARYVDQKLVAASGPYNYRINTTLYSDNQGEFEFEDYKKYTHLIHRVDDRTLIVVSRKNMTFFDRVTVFSYLFAFFGLLMLMLVLLQSPGVMRLTFFNHLNVKIQLLSTGIILVALLSFGFATRIYTSNQLQEKNESILSEKIQSVLIELEAPLKNADTLSAPLVDQISAMLTRLSYVFFTDINVYDLGGKLVATSQPKIYDTGLMAPRMNAEAFVKVTINKKSDYIHEETVGSLNYLSAYVPFRNYNNDIVAYVNLPYFARQDALEEEITRLLVTLVNIFVLLLALSVIAAVIITDWITRPLQQLQYSLSRIELGRRNEQIEYKGTDVIASLVNEYNRKVAELEINAEQLARSERESAWREMAKQVAHEIKNPLTPMKLNIQLLQRAAAEGADDLEERFERTAESLIEQIDTLSQIASAFSNFAKMPRAEMAEVNLNKLISSAVDLYKELPGAEIRFAPYATEAPLVHADYNQLLRAIQNLIKNGLQACTDIENPIITIRIVQSEGAFVVEITDNGEGIPEELQDRIFQPNFTTKSTGMGLGLAMVKSIVLNIHGKIWFETESGRGTSFFIEIPTAIH